MFWLIVCALVLTFVCMYFLLVFCCLLSHYLSLLPLTKNMVHLLHYFWNLTIIITYLPQPNKISTKVGGRIFVQLLIYTVCSASIWVSSNNKLPVWWLLPYKGKRSSGRPFGGRLSFSMPRGSGSFSNSRSGLGLGSQTSLTGVEIECICLMCSLTCYFF